MGTNFGGHFPAVRKVSQRDKLMFFAVIGLVISLAMLVIVFNSKGKGKEQATKKEEPVQIQTTSGTVTLYASEKFVRQGSKLSDYKFREVYWPRNSVPDGAVRNLAEMQDMYAKLDIPNGVPIQADHLTKEKGATILDITSGMRAVTIPIDEKSGVEGWAQPGSRVDVILTYMQDAELKSKIMVEYARVLSLGGDSRDAAQRNVAGTQTVQAQRTITLEVTPGDALKVQTALQLGKLSLILRDGGDSKTSDKMEVTQGEIGGNAKNKKPDNTCSKGTMRMGGKEYMINCDGSMTQLNNTDVP